jgi:hypothetical protein
MQSRKNNKGDILSSPGATSLTTSASSVAAHDFIAVQLVVP